MTEHTLTHTHTHTQNKDEPGSVQALRRRWIIGIPGSGCANTKANMRWSFFVSISGVEDWCRRASEGLGYY